MMAAINVDAIPLELREKDQWVVWRYEWRTVKGKKKKTKVPYSSRTNTKANTTDPETWSDFQSALNCADWPAYDGIGFVFNDDYIGVDLDHAFVTGSDVPEDWALEILGSSQTYTESSPSGTGVHLIARGKLPGPGHNKRDFGGNGGALEMYSRGRYFTVTGRQLNPIHDIADANDAVFELYRKLESAPNGSTSRSSKKGSTPAFDPGDYRLRFEAAMRDPVVSNLWNGDLSDNNNDHSAGDLALCNKICFYFGKDPSLIDLVFRQSGLMRDKWLRDDYRAWTINEAIAGTPETWTPSKQARTTEPGGKSNHRVRGNNTESGDRPHGNGEGNAAESKLDTGSKPIANLANAVRIIENDPEFCAVWRDEFLQRILTGSPAKEWGDADDIHLTLRFQREKSMPRMSRDTVTQAVIEIAHRHNRNCAKDFLESLEWDGEERIDDFFTDHFGAPGSEYVKAAAKNFWLSLVARVYRPGCQSDHMIVLEGAQGIGKSSALRIVGGDWFCEQHESVTKKDFYENLQGKLLVEISEMDSFNRSEVTKVKQVITTVSDRYRESYGRKSIDHPRQCIFAGTTNSDSWNRDESGARRFWPIACKGQIDTEAIRKNREQYFAEAVHRFNAGESWHVMPIEETRNEQEARYVEPAWCEPIQFYIENVSVWDVDHWKSTPRAESLTELSAAEVLKDALHMPEAAWTKSNEMRVGEALRFMGWTKKDKRHEGRVGKRWLSPSKVET